VCCLLVVGEADKFYKSRFRLEYYPDGLQKYERLRMEGGLEDT
jgi:hypothetical protein